MSELPVRAEIRFQMRELSLRLHNGDGRHATE
jgi:hypothetical protein